MNQILLVTKRFISVGLKVFLSLSLFFLLFISFLIIFPNFGLNFFNQVNPILELESLAIYSSTSQTDREYKDQSSQKFSIELTLDKLYLEPLLENFELEIPPNLQGDITFPEKLHDHVNTSKEKLVQEEALLDLNNNQKNSIHSFFESTVQSAIHYFTKIFFKVVQHYLRGADEYQIEIKNIIKDGQSLGSLSFHLKEESVDLNDKFMNSDPNSQGLNLSSSSERKDCSTKNLSPDLESEKSSQVFDSSDHLESSVNSCSREHDEFFSLRYQSLIPELNNFEVDERHYQLDLITHLGKEKWILQSSVSVSQHCLLFEKGILKARSLDQQEAFLDSSFEDICFQWNEDFSQFFQKLDLKSSSFSKVNETISPIIFQTLTFKSFTFKDSLVHTNISDFYYNLNSLSKELTDSLHQEVLSQAKVEFFCPETSDLINDLKISQSLDQKIDVLINKSEHYTLQKKTPGLWIFFQQQGPEGYLFYKKRDGFFPKLSFQGFVPIQFLKPWQKEDLNFDSFTIHHFELDMQELKLTLGGFSDLIYKSVLAPDLFFNLQVQYTDHHLKSSLEIFHEIFERGFIENYEYEYPEDTLKTQLKVTSKDIYEFFDLPQQFLTSTPGVLTYSSRKDFSSEHREDLEKHFTYQSLTLEDSTPSNLGMTKSLEKTDKAITFEPHFLSSKPFFYEIKNFKGDLFHRQGHINLDLEVFNNRGHCSFSAEDTTAVHSDFQCEFQTLEQKESDRQSLFLKGFLHSNPLLAEFSVQGPLINNFFKEQFSLQYDPQIKKVFLRTESSAQDKHFFYYEKSLNPNSQEQKINSSHKKLTLTVQDLFLLFHLKNPEAPLKTTLSTHIDLLEFNQLHFHQVDFQFSPELIHLEGSYRQSPLSIDYFPQKENLHVNLEQWNLEDVFELKEKFLPLCNSSENILLNQDKSSPENQEILFIDFNSTKTKAYDSLLGDMSATFQHKQGALSSDNFILNHEDFKLETTLGFNRDFFAIQGTLVLEKWPEIGQKVLSEHGFLEANGKVEFEFSSDHRQQSSFGKIDLKLTDCLCTQQPHEFIRLMQLLSGSHLFKKYQSSINSEKKSLFIDNLQLQANLEPNNEFNIRHLMIKIGPLMSIFHGQIIGDRIDGVLTIIPRFTQVLPTAAFLSGQFLLGSTSLIIDKIFGHEIAKLSMESYEIHASISETLASENINFLDLNLQSSENISVVRLLD